MLKITRFTKDMGLIKGPTVTGCNDQPDSKPDSKHTYLKGKTSKDKQAYMPRGEGTLIFFFIRRLVPSIYRSLPKNIRNFKQPKNRGVQISFPSKLKPLVAKHNRASLVRGAVIKGYLHLCLRMDFL